MTMDYVIMPPVTPAILLASSESLFPVNRIYCVGRNYADHAIEMGHDPEKEDPFFFKKSPDNLLLSSNLDGGNIFPYPSQTQEVHYEIELVVALREGGTDIPIDKTANCIWGFAVGLDLTRRDLQGEAKKTGRPWLGSVRLGS